MQNASAKSGYTIWEKKLQQSSMGKKLGRSWASWSSSITSEGWSSTSDANKVEGFNWLIYKPNGSFRNHQISEKKRNDILDIKHNNKMIFGFRTKMHADANRIYTMSCHFHVKKYENIMWMTVKSYSKLIVGFTVPVKLTKNIITTNRFTVPS